jgi:hypothetical protein
MHCIVIFHLQMCHTAWHCASRKKIPTSNIRGKSHHLFYSFFTLRETFSRPRKASFHCFSLLSTFHVNFPFPAPCFAYYPQGEPCLSTKVTKVTKCPAIKFQRICFMTPHQTCHLIMLQVCRECLPKV